MIKDKLFLKEYGRELLSIASGDLASAQVLAADRSKGRKENICFTAQQCIEKALKAVICAKGDPVPLTHTIELLIDRLGSGYVPPHSESLVELTDFATVKRYQEGSEIITDQDVDATLNAAKTVLDWAGRSIKTLLG